VIDNVNNGHFKVFITAVDLSSTGSLRFPTIKLNFATNYSIFSVADKGVGVTG